MKFSVFLKSNTDDAYYVYLAPLDAGIEHDLALKTFI